MPYQIKQEEVNPKLDSSIVQLQSTMPIQLIEIHPGKHLWPSSIGDFLVLGSVSLDFSNLKGSYSFQAREKETVYRNKFDLFDMHQTNEFVSLICTSENIEVDIMLFELMKFTKVVETFREIFCGIQSTMPFSTSQVLSPSLQKNSISFLSNGDMLDMLDSLMTNAGFTCSRNSRLLLFLIASSYKMLNPIYGILHSPLHSQTTRIFNVFRQLIPPDDLILLSHIPKNGLLHLPQSTLNKKMIIVPSPNNLNEHVWANLEELKISGVIGGVNLIKDVFGKQHSKLHIVEARFSLLTTLRDSTNTREPISNAFWNIDVSQDCECSPFINESISGLMSNKLSTNSRSDLMNLLKLIRPYSVHIPFKIELNLPVTRELNSELNQLLYDIIEQVVLIHQFQRHKDNNNRLVAEMSDMEHSIELFTELMIIDFDDLNFREKAFFQQLKDYLLREYNDVQHSFTAYEITAFCNIGRSTTARHLKKLLKFEYLRVWSGTANKGFNYKIVILDHMDKYKKDASCSLKLQLMNQKGMTMGH
ncbi:MAG: hypothetical protein RL092_673 [Bacteroidota bacterium]|jgi:hypothetical protein